MTLRQIILDGASGRDPVAAELPSPELALIHEETEVPGG
jgi:hypothetical protein